jgi:hypothetical protein
MGTRLGIVGRASGEVVIRRFAFMAIGTPSVQTGELGAAPTPIGTLRIPSGGGGAPASPD